MAPTASDRTHFDPQVVWHQIQLLDSSDLLLLRHLKNDQQENRKKLRQERQSLKSTKSMHVMKRNRNCGLVQENCVHGCHGPFALNG